MISGFWTDLHISCAIPARFGRFGIFDHQKDHYAPLICTNEGIQKRLLQVYMHISNDSSCCRIDILSKHTFFKYIFSCQIYVVVFSQATISARSKRDFFQRYNKRNNRCFAKKKSQSLPFCFNKRNASYQKRGEKSRTSSAHLPVWHCAKHQ